jgi:hypothetical protein
MMVKEGRTAFFPVIGAGKIYQSKAHLKQRKLEEKYENLAEKAEAIALKKQEQAEAIA